MLGYSDRPSEYDLQNNKETSKKWQTKTEWKKNLWRTSRDLRTILL